LPLRAVIAPGNRYDSPFLTKLIEDLEAEYILADAGYDSRANVKTVKGLLMQNLLLLVPRKVENARRLSMLFF
jgi:hypothetical protein